MSLPWENFQTHFLLFFRDSLFAVESNSEFLSRCHDRGQWGQEEDQGERGRSPRGKYPLLLNETFFFPFTDLFREKLFCEQLGLKVALFPPPQAVPNMVPFKRPANEKSGLPVFQPAAAAGNGGGGGSVAAGGGGGVGSNGIGGAAAAGAGGQQHLQGAAAVEVSPLQQQQQAAAAAAAAMTAQQQQSQQPPPSQAAAATVAANSQAAAAYQQALMQLQQQQQQQQPYVPVTCKPAFSLSDASIPIYLSALRFAW